MTTDRDLTLALLALDAYNHGYNIGIEGVGNQIGSAVITNQEFSESQKNAGFYAVAYRLADGTKVISYRGTTFELGINTYRDVLQGWTLGVGYASASQAQLAKSFYEDVTDKNWGHTPFFRSATEFGHAPNFETTWSPMSSRGRPSAAELVGRGGAWWGNGRAQGVSVIPTRRCCGWAGVNRDKGIVLDNWA